jgi:hypothetical protein
MAGAGSQMFLSSFLTFGKPAAAASYLDSFLIW